MNKPHENAVFFRVFFANLPKKHRLEKHAFCLFLCGLDSAFSVKSML